MTKTILNITNLKVNYGNITALKGININIEEGKIVALLGSNGAGKTTTLRKISGVLDSSDGKIEFQGQDITKMEANKIASLGIIQSPEGRQIFKELTVEENLKIGSYTLKDKKAIEKNFDRV